MLSTLPGVKQIEQIPVPGRSLVPNVPLPSLPNIFGR
jgi:hypothetical protein